VLHLCRAIVRLPDLNLTQSFISHRSGVSQGTLSHYVRGLHVRFPASQLLPRRAAAG
jgi:transcriptional regulator with XRE-family HTH domain